jgi:arginyl-tRNA synthetase
MNFFKEKIVSLLTKYSGLEKLELTRLLEIPPEKSLGDFSLPCFELAKKFKKSPVMIAEELQSKIPKNKIISRLETKNGYLNFFINKEESTKYILKEVLSKKNKYGSSTIGKKRPVMIEYSSPNTNKPLHLGHVRNNVLGMSLSNILEMQGYKVIKSCLVNDRGVHICKSMLAYMKYGENKLPDKKPDHFVGDFYVLFSKKLQESPELEKEALELLNKWEQGDKKTIALWKKMNSWVYKGFNETYKDIGSSFDKIYYESQMYNKGKDIVFKGLKDNKFKEEEGAIIADLSKYNLPNKVLIRSDKTSLYITQDIYLAKLKFEQYKLYKSIYVVGNEQLLHFKQLFSILDLLGELWYKDCFHLSYGYVSLPSGRMKSREGTVIDADDLIKDLTNIARNELIKRHKLPPKELERRARIIALGAIKFFFIKYETFKDFVFDPQESLSFEGETGPYIQYTYARANSILRKNKTQIKAYNSKELIEKEEIDLVDKLSNFKDIIEEASISYKPSLVAHYLIELCQQFNEFYQKCPVMDSKKGVKEARITLVKSTIQVISNASIALNMPLLNEM